MQFTPIFIPIAVILIVSIYFLSRDITEGLSLYSLPLQFSPVEDDVSHGNPISWSKRPNMLVTPRPQYNTGNLTDVAFHAHGIPLDYETYRTKKDSNPNTLIDTLSSRNIKCEPGCCPSPYSCDHGCLCYHLNTVEHAPTHDF